MSVLVIVDPRVAEYQTLLASLPLDTDVLLLNDEDGGVQQIWDYVSGRGQYDAIHVLSHGGSGTLFLGSTSVTTDNLQTDASLWQSIGNCLTPTGDLLLYGCDVAQGEAGQAFIQQLALMTGADVAASTDLTGAYAKNGNWVLEVRTGGIEAAVLSAGSEFQSTLGFTAGHAIDAANDIRDAGMLAVAAYDVGRYVGNYDDSTRRVNVQDYLATLDPNWHYVNPAAFGVPSDRIDSHGYYDVLNYQALLAFNSSTKTLAISFRGTEEPADLVADIFGGLSFGIGYYGGFEALVNAVVSQAQSFGADRILLTGHSFGGAMVEEAMASLKDSGLADGLSLTGITFGSPGVNDIQDGYGTDQNLINIGHVDFAGNGDPVYRLIDKLLHNEDVQGSDIHVNIPSFPDGDLNLHNPLMFDYTQHIMSIYEATANIIAGELMYSASYNNSFDVRSYSYVYDVTNNDLSGSASQDVIVGNAGSQRLFGFDGNDILDGKWGRDIIFAGDGNDTVYGGSGNDSIVGGPGNDRLYGESGNDIYKFSTGNGVDNIVESGGQDSIQINDSGQIHYSLSANKYDLIISYTGGSITIANMNQLGSRVETLQQYTTDGSAKIGSGISLYDEYTSLQGVVSQPPKTTAPTVNQAPVISAGIRVFTPGEVVDVNGLFGASDPDGDNVQNYHFTYLGGSGQLVLNGTAVAANNEISVSDAELQAGNLTFRVGASGSFESIAISASDGKNWSALYFSYLSATSNADQVGGVSANHAPTAQDDAYTVTAGTTVTVPVLANDTDPEGDRLSIVALEGNNPNLVSIASDGRSLVVTTPVTMDWPFRFTYDISDGHGGSASANATITVNPSTATNHAPVGCQLDVIVPADDSTAIDLSNHAKDPDLGDTFGVTWIGNPEHGTLTKNGALITYHPSAGYSGEDTVDFVVTDNHGAMNTLTLALTVKAQLQAQDDFYVTDYQQAITFNPVENDKDDTDGVFANPGSMAPQHGTLVENQNGSLTYTPAAGFYGTDHFQYLAQDPLGGSDYGWITIAVRDPNGGGGVINGSSGDDTLIGTPSGEIINGLGGDDVIAPGAGNDEVDGGDGFDTLDYSSSPAAVNATIEEPFTAQNGTVVWATSNDGYGGTDTLKNAEAIVGSAYDDMLVGNSGYNVLKGGAGDDYIFATYGESFTGDWVDGGDGNDVVQNFVSNTTVVGGSGNDQVLGNPPRSATWGAANNQVDGGDGNDRIVLWGTSNTVYGGAGNDTISTGGYVDAGPGDDRVTQYEEYIGDPNYADDDWHLGDGNDYAVAGHGHDLVYGDNGDDTIVATRIYTTVDSSADYYDGGDGIDTLNYSDFSTNGLATHSFVADYFAGTVVRPDGLVDVAVNFENFRLDGDYTYSVTFIGNDAANDVETGDGRDLLQGRGGDDRLASQNGADTFIGGAGADFIDPGADQILDSGTVDHIIYQSIGDAGDTISGNFKTGVGGDVLDFSGVLSGVGYVGTTPIHDGYLRLVASGNCTVVQLDLDGAGDGAQFKTLATIQGTTPSAFVADNFASAVDVAEISVPGTGSGPVMSDWSQSISYQRSDASIALGSMVVADPDPSALVTVELVIADPAAGLLSASSGAVYNSVSGIWSVEGSIAEVNEALASVAFLPNAGYENDTTISTFVSDGGATPQAGLIMLSFYRTPTTLEGTDGDDYFVVHSGDYLVFGEGGFNEIDYGYSGEFGIDVDLINGTATTIDGRLDRLFDIQSVYGTFFGDTLVGGGDNNILSGGLGNDSLSGGKGVDTLIGGLGDDIYVVDNFNDVVIEDSDEGIDLVKSSINWNLLRNLENLTLTGNGNANGVGNILDNVITGNAGNNVLSGLAGDDTLKGGAGNDRLIGGAGLDSLIGGAGEDTYVVNNGGDVITEGTNAGTDTVRSTVDWTLGANLENLTLTGNGNANGVGNILDNVITGNAGNNVLSGLAGDDTLKGGGAGMDTLIGGMGDDTYIVDNTADVVAEGADAGTDTVLSTLDWALGANLENLTLTDKGNVNGTGNGLNNVITGNAGNNVLNGLAGDDTLKGGAGNDKLMGGAGLDSLIGGAGDDALKGGAGNDKLIGGLGNDTLAGGNGQDMFLFDAALSNQDVDKISDFNPIDDAIQLSHAIFSKLGVGSLSAADFWASSSGVAHDGNDFILYNTSTGALYYDPDGNGPGVAIKFATLWDSPSTHPTITNVDFLIV